MRMEPAFATGTNLHSFRQGEQAEILGVKMVIPENQTQSRACLHVKYSDGIEDYISMQDPKDFEIDVKLRG